MLLFPSLYTIPAPFLVSTQAKATSGLGLMSFDFAAVSGRLQGTESPGGHLEQLFPWDPLF